MTSDHDPRGPETRDTMDKLKMHTPNLTEDSIAKLAELFPSCVTEVKDEQGRVKRALDFDQLRQELSEHIVDGPQERYHGGLKFQVQRY